MSQHLGKKLVLTTRDHVSNNSEINREGVPAFDAALALSRNLYPLPNGVIIFPFRSEERQQPRARKSLRLRQHPPDVGAENDCSPEHYDRCFEH